MPHDELNEVRRVEAARMRFEIVSDAAGDEIVTKLLDRGFAGYDPFQFLTCYAAPLHPSMRIRGFVELSRPAKGIYCRLQLVVRELDGVSFELFLDQARVDEPV